MNKIGKASIFIVFLLIGLLIVFSNPTYSDKKSYTLNESFKDLGVDGMKIISFKINDKEIKIKDYDDSSLNFNTTFIKTNKGIKQDIYIKNKKLNLEIINFSIVIEINYDEIRWNGTRYKLNKTQIELKSYYKDGELVTPNIFMDDIYNKRINYKDIVGKGGYAIAYKKGNQYLIELITENINIESQDYLYIDPTYSNATDGFNIDTEMNNPQGLATNGSDIFIFDTELTGIYHYFTDGTYNGSITTPCGAGESLACNETDCWTSISASMTICKYNMYTKLNPYNFTVVGDNEIWGGTIDDDGEFYYTTRWTGINVSIHKYNPDDGSHLGSFAMVSDDDAYRPASLGDNGTDIYTVDRASANEWMYHYDSYGVNQSDGFNISNWGIADAQGLDFIGNDIYIADSVDLFVYHLETSNTAPTLTDIPDNITNEDISWSFILDDYVSDNSDTDAQITWLHINNDTSRVSLSIDNSTNNISITPVANATGFVNITLTAVDTGGLNSDNSSFTLNLTAINDPPYIFLDDNSTNEDVSWSINLTNYTSDVDNDTVDELSWIYRTNDTANSYISTIAIDNTTGNLSITPVDNATGIINITINVTEGTRTKSDSFLFTITAINDPPFFSESPEDNSTNEDISWSLILNQYKGDIDDDNSTLNFAYLVNDSSMGTIAIDNTTDNLSYTPNANETGIIEITLQVWDDDNSYSQNKSFNLTITAINDPPTIDIADNSTNEDISWSLILDDYTDDVDNSLGTLLWTYRYNDTTRISSMAIDNSTGNLSLTPSANMTGIVNITINVTDGSLTGSDSFEFTLNAVNDKPYISPSISNFSIKTNITLDLTDYENDNDSTSFNWSYLIANTTVITLGIGNETNQLNITIGGDGNTTINLTLYDDGGLTDTQDLIYITLDTTAPSVSILSGSNTSTQDTSLTVIGYANDTNTIDNCTIYIDSLHNITNSSVTQNTNMSFTVSGFSTTKHYYNITCTDNFNNTGYSSVYYFDVLAPDSTTGGYGSSSGTSTVKEINFTRINISVSPIWRKNESETFWIYVYRDNDVLTASDINITIEPDNNKFALNKFREFATGIYEVKITPNLDLSDGSYLLMVNASRESYGKVYSISQSKTIEIEDRNIIEKTIFKEGTDYKQTLYIILFTFGGFGILILLFTIISYINKRKK